MSESPQTKIYDEFLFNSTTHLLKPLNEILNSCEKLLKSAEGVPDGTQKKLRGEILNHGHQLLDLVNDIRDYARIQTGRMLLEKKSTDMGMLMKGVLDIASLLVENKPQLRIQQNIPVSLPNLSIDPVRIRQVLINLIHNAVKFSDTGAVAISVELSDKELTFQVKDTGIGIAKNKFELVFAPFQTAIQDKTDSRVGLGLGLPICKYFVEAHNGQLLFESNEGKGSTFYFSLPVEQTK